MPDYAQLIPRLQARDERPYRHAVRVARVRRGTGEQQHRFTFHPDNKLRFDTPVADGDAHTRYHFPDEAVARKFANRFDGEYLGEIDG